MFADWSGGSRLPKEKKMGCHKRKDAGRNEKNVGHKEPRDGERAHVRATAHHALGGFADHRNLAGRIGSHGSRKVGSLVPWKQITRESHPENEREEHASGEPKDLPPSFVRPVNIGL